MYSYKMFGFLFNLSKSQIKTSGSESRGQEEAACTRVLGLCDHYSDQDER